MIRRHWPRLGLALLLLATWVAYFPGLSGGFLFDDFVNLDALNSPGPVDNWPAFWRYLTSGIADPTGRPLSLLSFLVDAREWPADPAPFLRTNVLLHLLDGVLLFFLLRRLGRHLDGAGNRTDAAALLGAGLWLLHPLFVSTTLYIVQREAMLPATFTLLGLLAYVHGRGLMATAPRAGMAWSALGLGAFTVLALLSKANGILLPLLAWTLEATVLRHGRAGPVAPLPRWLWVSLLLLPSLVVLAYLASFLPELHDPLQHRPWTIAQRLLTQPRVLVDYLLLLAVPRVLSTGLYNDGYQAAAGLLSPPGTLPALLLVLALLLAGLGLRRRAPAVAAALLFFFAGHALESTTIPLELYFEHRNYLPAMLLFWPLARGVVAWRTRIAWRATVALGLLALCGAITWQRAGLWGDPDRMALLWAAQNPQSPRAQATAAMIESRTRPDLALQRLGPLWRRHPHDLQFALNYANAACALGALPPADVAGIAGALRHADHGDQLLHRWLSRALQVAESGQCAGVDDAAIERWLEAARDNPRFMQVAGRRQDLASIAGQLALLRGQPERALHAFDEALAAEPTPDAAAMQTALLATRGHYREALSHLDTYARLSARSSPPPGRGMPRVHEWVLARQGYWAYELGLLRRKLHAEIAAQEAANGG